MATDTRLDRDTEALARAIGDFARVIQFRDRDRACCYELSVSQCYALDAVIRDPGCTLNDLASHLYLEKSTTSRLVQGLVAEGFLERSPAPHDGRALLLTASPRGREVHACIHDEMCREYEKILEPLGPEERKAVIGTVRALARSFAARVQVDAGSCCVVR